jgi:hypothetical protein
MNSSFLVRDRAGRIRRARYAPANPARRGKRLVEPKAPCGAKCAFDHGRGLHEAPFLPRYSFQALGNGANRVWLENKLVHTSITYTELIEETGTPSPRSLD